MSERFKEHDWKSCDGGDSSGGSNPLLCAKSNPTEPCEWAVGFILYHENDMIGKF